jgi:hypothetical protein
LSFGVKQRFHLINSQASRSSGFFLKIAIFTKLNTHLEWMKLNIAFLFVSALKSLPLSQLAWLLLKNKRNLRAAHPQEESVSFAEQNPELTASITETDAKEMDDRQKGLLPTQNDMKSSSFSSPGEEKLQ